MGSFRAQQSPPGSIPEALAATAARGAGEYVFYLDDGSVRLSCSELAERAAAGAQRLLALGVRPGDPVGLLGRNRPEWVVSAFAVWTAGAVLVPIQKRLRVPAPEAFSEQLHMLLSAADCRRVLVDPELTHLLPAGVAVPWGEGKGDTSDEEPQSPGRGDPAVIQFTSGSTSVPRGALVSHAAVMAQMRILDSLVAEGGSPRRAVGWAPFFHDLGLFLSVLPPAVWGQSAHLLPTERFARDPAEWLRLAESTRASLTLAPSSGFGSALRTLSRRRERVDLSALKVARFAAEPVDPSVLEQLSRESPGHGLSPEAIGSTYGMAEVVLAVTYSLPGLGPCVDEISVEALAAEGVALPASGGEPSRTLVGCGTPMMELRVVGPEGDLPERHVGEILLRSNSLMDRYVGPGAPDPFVNGWLHSGDMGYMAGDQLYITGRVKDMVIVGGHNYYPEDFEWAAGRVEGVRPGRCVAVGLAEADEVVIMVEAQEAESAKRLRREVKNRVADAIGVVPSEVIVLPQGSVEKTTSGKLRRATMRHQYVSGTLVEREL